MSDSPEPQLTERERAVLREAVLHGPCTWREMRAAIGRSNDYFGPSIHRLRRDGLIRDYRGIQSLGRSIVATEAGRRALHTRAGFPPRSEWPTGASDGYFDGLGNMVWPIEGVVLCIDAQR